jgi:ribokinase
MQGNLSWPATRAAAETARRRGARIMLNAAPLLWPGDALGFAWDVLVVNESEAVGLTGASGAPAAALLRGRGAGLAIVTMGAAGCAVASDDGVRMVAARPVTAVDSAGAGDAFCGALAALIVGGRPWPDAVAAAQRAAAIAVSRRGVFTALPTQAELGEILAVAP